MVLIMVTDDRIAIDAVDTAANATPGDMVLDLPAAL